MSLAIEPNTKSVAFTFALVGLAAKFALLDGPINASECNAFSSIFTFTHHTSYDITQLWNEACADTSPYNFHAEQIAKLYKDHSLLLMREILEACFNYALCDGKITIPELRALRHITHIFGLPMKECSVLLRKHLMPDYGDPCRILNLPPRASKEEIKHAYYHKIRQYHPDSLLEKEYDHELFALQTEYCTYLTQAYHHLLRK